MIEADPVSGVPAEPEGDEELPPPQARARARRLRAGAASRAVLRRDERMGNSRRGSRAPDGKTVNLIPHGPAPARGG
jgi:hypothetical protein